MIRENRYAHPSSLPLSVNATVTKGWKNVSVTTPASIKAKKWQPKIRNEITLAMHGCRGNREEFVRLLADKGIDALFRENDEGRIYGATFIDHKNREVYNGSRLGKEFSANAFERLFNNPDNIPNVDAHMPDIGLQSGFSSDMESAIEQAFGIFAMEQNGPDPQEEALARRLQRKKEEETPLTRNFLITDFSNIKISSLCNRKMI